MDMQRLSQALKAAHAAGDTAAATKLAQEIRRLQQQSNPEGTGIGRAIKRGAVQTAAAPFTLAATADVRALGDIGKSEDAIRYDEAIRAGVPTQAFASRAANISDPRQVNSMMQQYGVSPAANVNYQQVVDKRLERRADAAQNPEEYLKRLSENSATAGRLFKLADSFARSPTADAYAKSLAEAPDGFKGWLSTVTDDPLGFMAFMGETIAESAPQIGAGLATSVVTGSPAAGAGVMSLGGFSREYANEVNNFLRENGIDLADPESAKKLFSSPELMDKANERGVTRGLVIAAADFAGQGLVAQQIIRKSLKRQAVAQGGSEGAGEALATKAVGDAFSFKETITEALAGTGSTIGEAAVAKTLFNKDGKLASADDLSTLPISEKLAAADVARMLDEISKANGYKLKNVDPSSNRGAKQTLEDARSTNVQAINDLKNVLKKQLDPKNAQSLEELLSVYSEAAAGIGAGKKKVSQKVTVSQLQALEELVGDTKEGQQLLQELLKSNVITDLFKDGMKGGVSQFTDLMNPVSHTGAVYDPSRWANVFLGGGAAIASKGATLVIPASGRVVDFFTGRRSKVARFVKNNKKALGLPAPEGTSLIEQKNKQKAAAKDRRLAVAKIAQLTNAPSSDYLANILAGTGLDRDGLNTVLKDMGEKFGSDPNFKSIIDDVVAQLEGEGTGFLDVLTEFIPVVGHHAQLYFPDLVVSAPDNLLLKRSFDSPNVQTDMPTMGGGGTNTDTSPQFGTPQFTTQENYNRGIEANRQAAQTLSLQAQNDPELDLKDKAVVASALDQLQFNLGSQPTIEAQAIFDQVKENINEDVAVKYIKPYVDRVLRQQRSNPVQAAADAGVAPEFDTSGLSERDARLINMTDEEIQADAEAFGKRISKLFNRDSDVPNADEAINPNIPLPTFEQTAALSPKTPVVHQQIDAPKGETNHGLLPHLRTESASFRDGKPLFTIKTNNKNAGRQIQAIDEIIERHPDPAGSSEAWAAMLGDALATKDIPVQPHGFIEDLNNGGAQELLSSLTPGQIADADHGFRNAAEFRRAYTNGEIGIEDTGRLFLWSFLSRGVSPYTQEGLFMDSFSGIEEWIRMAAGKSNRGSLKDNMKGYKKWAASTAPKGSGKPGAGAMHNLNAFGETFLLKMSEDAGKGDGRSRLQVIHDMMSDPNSTGKEVRREFLRMGEGVGIDNKVVSFTLLVAGYPDVMVLDRVQMRQMWNDGRFSGLNLYDGYKNDGNVVTGSGLSQLTYGARGLLVYEAMERSLQNRINQIYSDVGRPDAASVGRYHWETWVASSQQEASHGTIDAILARAKGDPNPLEGVTAKEGEYGAYAYGAKYGLENGVPMFTYDVPDRGTYKFTVPDFQSFLNDIKRKAKSNKVIPYGFSVKESGNAPWYTREGVNLDALAEKAKQYGTQVSRTDEGIRQGQAVPDGRNTDAAVGRTDEQRVPILTDRSDQDRGRSSATGVYANPLRKTNLRKIKEAIIRSRPAYQVGLKGGRLEDGIQDIDTALEVANSLGMTVRLFNSLDEMNDAKRKAGLPVVANSAGTFYRGMTDFKYGTYQVDPKAKGFEGTVFALKPNAVVNGKPISELDALSTILHEMSHGMTLGNMQLSELQNPNKEFFNPYNHDFDHAPVGSFARSAILPFIMDSSPSVSKGVLKEIQELQENLDVYTTNNPKERIAVRHIRSILDRISAYEMGGASRDAISAMEAQAAEYMQYTRNIRETSADPVWVYLLNPKLAKKLMPKTTALIRAEFDKAKNPKIQFFSHPLAVVAAVVAAMMSQAQEDEERERQQQMMPPGALSPQQQMVPGALTA